MKEFIIFVCTDSTEIFFSKLRSAGLSFTQTKKKRPIFMVLYLSIQLRYRNKTKTKMFIKRRTHKKWQLFDFIFLSWRVIEPNMLTAFSILTMKLIIKTRHN